MYPILFSFGRLHVYSHGLMIALGAILGGLAIFYLAKQKKLQTNFILDLCVYTLLAGLIGSRLLFIILYFDQFQNWQEMVYIWYGGLVSYGGIAGGFVVAWLFLKAKKEPVLKWFDIGIIGLLIGWALGRVGCLLNGDSYGIISSGKLAIWGRLPSPIFESIWVLIVAVLAYFGLAQKENRKLPDGVIFFSGIALYAIGRFAVDFFRDEPVTVWFMKTGQFGSLLVLVAAILAIRYLIIKPKRGSNGSF